MENLSLIFSVLLVACVTNVICLSDEMKELMDMLHNTCVSETGVSEDLIKATMQGNFADDQALKCYMKCILTETASMGEDGMIDVEATISMLPEEMQEDIPPVLRKCDTQVGSDHCDTAWLTNKCWYENKPDKYILI